MTQFIQLNQWVKSSIFHREMSTANIPTQILNILRYEFMNDSLNLSNVS